MSELETVGGLDNQTKTNNEVCISYNDIANKLLKDRFLLTALEFHSELVECGKEIPKLKEFFSNPGNFENQFSKPDYCAMPRSSSQATLDSLDMTRFSEDGERGVDERVAVLEFELRKAKETISALRANLTVATECDTPMSEHPASIQCEPIKPHEQRALNFLINEYLLLHNYKLTSITFADENENQDFEDWDDVGLNIPKPAELLQLYRDAMRQPGHGAPMRDCGSQVTLATDEELALKQQVMSLTVELEEVRTQLVNLEREKAELTANIERLSTVETVPTHYATETVSVRSATPEHFEMIDAAARHGSESGSGMERLCDDNDTSSLNDTEWTRVNACIDSETGSALGHYPEGSGRPGDIEGGCEEREEPAGAEDPLPLDLLSPSVTANRSLPPEFQREVVCRCFVNTARVGETPLLHELLHEGISLARLTHVVALTLPRIIPNVLINKREELIPLLVCTIHLHQDSAQRDTLLQWLFNLKKRPQEEERRCILAGMVSLARASSQTVIESELLPHCWEQMSHKHTERRLLVAEACSALAPYISAGLRNSLLLSILQQLLGEDREETVRVSCVRSLALIVAVMADTDKYTQCEELTLIALQDSATAVADSAVHILLPILAQWSLTLHYLQDKLLTRLLSSLHAALKRSGGGASVLLLSAVRSLLPYLVMSVAAVETVTSRILPGLPLAEPRSGFADLCQGLANPAIFYNGEFTVGSVMSAFDVVVRETRWSELDWVLNTMIPKLLDSLDLVDVTNEDLLNGFIAFFKSLTAGFGKTVTVNMIKPIFSERLNILESRLVNLDKDWPNLSLIPVYLLAVVAPVQSEVGEVGNTVQRFLLSLALCGAPVDCLQVSVSQLSKVPALHETLMTALWEGVVHPRPSVRAVTATMFGHAIRCVGESMTTNRIVPALITLASDPDITVKTATIPVFGTLIEYSTNKEVEDKTYFQLQSLLSDPTARDSHPALLQLVATLGRIVSRCDSWFRDDVVVPQLAATAAYTLQLTNQSRRLDLALALVQAFNNAVYCSLSKSTITTALIPGLRYLEQVCSQSLTSHHETVLSMIQEAESRSDTAKPIERSSSTLSLAMATSNVGQGMEDVKNRVTKIFQTPISRPTNLPNLQSINNIFRKK
ncbi:RAB11-binding protein RELCH homolog [Homalodisca vitripennis]|uniref:RAB11-binding protein RELCH homolog n=1 Tax=Homalodisca vitripennis TaxID=197043 RepID=UPI001EEA8250|nr:RAB11-binding protein RELCH homolog [Homalodisca vitripennis]